MATRRNPKAPGFVGGKFVKSAQKKFSKFTTNLPKRVSKKKR
jgi:hypothetical protein